MTPTFAVSPLSPERACAIAMSWIFIRLRLLDLDDRLDGRLRNERGPGGDDLLDARAAAGEARDVRRPGEHERRELLREALDGGLVLAAHADAELDLGEVLRRIARDRSVARVRADELREHLVELQPQPVQPLAKDPVGGERLLVGVRPRIDERADGLVAGRVADRDLVELGLGAAL